TPRRRCAQDNRGIPRLRHRLCHDAGRSGGRDQDRELFRLSGDLRVYARRQRRFLCRRRHGDKRLDDHGLFLPVAHPPKGPDMRRSAAATIAIHAGALLLAAVTLAPLVWLFIMSIMEPRELLAVPLKWLPEAPDFSRYGRLLGFTGEIAGNPFLN